MVFVVISFRSSCGWLLFITKSDLKYHLFSEDSWLLLKWMTPFTSHYHVLFPLLIITYHYRMPLLLDHHMSPNWDAGSVQDGTLSVLFIGAPLVQSLRCSITSVHTCLMSEMSDTATAHFLLLGWPLWPHISNHMVCEPWVVPEEQVWKESHTLKRKNFTTLNKSALK